MGSRVQVSVLCPGFLDTEIYRSERNMPDAVRAVAGETAIAGDTVDAIRAMVPGPELAADVVVDGIRTGRFYLFTHERAAIGATEQRLAWMRGGDPPASDPTHAFVP